MTKLLFPPVKNLTEIEFRYLLKKAGIFIEITSDLPMPPEETRHYFL